MTLDSSNVPPSSSEDWMEDDNGPNDSRRGSSSFLIGWGCCVHSIGNDALLGYDCVCRASGCFLLPRPNRARGFHPDAGGDVLV